MAAIAAILNEWRRWASKETFLLSPPTSHKKSTETKSKMAAVAAILDEWRSWSSKGTFLYSPPEKSDQSTQTFVLWLTEIKCLRCLRTPTSRGHKHRSSIPATGGFCHMLLRQKSLVCSGLYKRMESFAYPDRKIQDWGTFLCKEPGILTASASDKMNLTWPRNPGPINLISLVINSAKCCFIG
jgi:hypothetical protein